MTEESYTEEECIVVSKEVLPFKVKIIESQDFTLRV